MDCTECQDLLLDLLSDELSPDKAAAVRAELASCSECRDVHARLKRGLSLADHFAMVEPPPALTQRILAIAEAEAMPHASTHAAVREPARPRSVSSPADEDRDRPSWLAVIGQMLMGRQVGMATIMLLLVAGTLWVLPEMRDQREPVGVTVVSPGADNRLPPATRPALEPAATGVGAGEKQEGAQRAADEAGGLAEASPAEAPASESAEEAPVAQAKPAGPRARELKARRASKRPAAAASKKKMGKAPAMNGMLDDLAVGSGGASKGAAAPQRRRSGGKADAPAASVTYAPPPAPAKPARPAPAEARAETEAEAAPSPMDAFLMDQLAAPAPAAAPDKDTAPSTADLRDQARKAFATKRCADGLAAFDSLAQRGQVARDQALLSGAIPCLTKAGRKAEAARWQARLDALREAGSK